MKTRVDIRIEKSLVIVIRNGVEYDVSNTNTWMFDLEDTLSLSIGLHKCLIDYNHFKSMIRDGKRLLTEFPSIQNIAHEEIIGQPNGCRINGGGVNRCLVTTTKNTYIVGGGEILKRLPEGVWEVLTLTSKEDLEFCDKLDENYDYCSGQFFNVIGCSMPQININYCS